MTNKSPTKKPTKKPPAKKSGQRRQGAAAASAARAKTRRLATSIVVGVVVLSFALALILAVALGGSSTTVSTPTGSAAKAIAAQATSVPPGVAEQVAAGTVKVLPKPISGPALTKDGKPEVLYIGAEYCPYCATERWALVEALSRFGTFSNLSFTHSSGTDIFPNTPTFTFHGSSYDSSYVAFTPVETATNKLGSNGAYGPLDSTTADQEAVWAANDPGQSIPFIDIGGRYVITGASYDPTVLQGKTAAEIGAALSDPTSAVAKGAIGTANGITAAICMTTNNQPANVCATPTIKALQAQLGTA